MGYWVRKLRAPGGDRQDQGLVELKAAAIEASAGVNQRPAIELVVAGRYLLRLWPGTRSEHLREVITVLEER
jgi:hypothetical protein